MEQVVMRKLTSALKIKPIFIFILLTAGICFSQTDSFPEDSIAAKFCFNADTSREDTQTIESVWKLSVYEQVIPLTVTIQTESYDFMPIISAELISNIRHRLSGIVLEGSGACYGYNPHTRKGYSCKINRKNEYFIYDYFNFLYAYTDSVKIPELFGKVLPLKWSLDFSMGKQKQTLSGTHYVYISGFCNEEQMTQIKESKKEKDERIQELKKEKEEQIEKRKKEEEKRRKAQEERYK